MSATAIPPASVRAAPQTLPQLTQPDPQTATPPAASPPAATAPSARDMHDAQVRGQVAGGALTAACFVGAGLAIAFCPFLFPVFAILGTAVGVDFLGDVMGFSPVKALTGKSIGGWLTGAPSARPTDVRPSESEEQNRAGFQLRARQPTPRRTPEAPDDAETPEPVPTS